MRILFYFLSLFALQLKTNHRPERDFFQSLECDLIVFKLYINIKTHSQPEENYNRNLKIILCVPKFPINNVVILAYK